MPAYQQNITPDTPMGANLVPGGATFRVWAPTADAVYVVLRDFDQSQPGHWVPNEADKLELYSNGRWAGSSPASPTEANTGSGPSERAGRGTSATPTPASWR
jgi:1,4-alpha-glucan branching enzyme